jgi:hypothetical protein
MTAQVQPAGSPAVVIGTDGTSPEAIHGGPPPLLAEPGAGGLNGTQDALSMLYSLVATQSNLAMTIGENGVASAEKSQQTQLALEKQAEIAQEQAEADQGGFWHDLLSVAEDVAKVAGIVVAAAAAAVATVCTAGTAGIAIVAIAAVLISAGAVVSATNCFGKDSQIIGMGMEVAGSILTAGVAASALASTTISEATQAVSSGAQVVEGVATVVAGISSIEVAKFQSESEDDAADVQHALNTMNQQSRIVNDLIAGLKSTEESNKNALQLVAGAARTYGQTLTAAASGGKA